MNQEVGYMISNDCLGMLFFVSLFLIACNENCTTVFNPQNQCIIAHFWQLLLSTHNKLKNDVNKRELRYKIKAHF